MRVDQSGGHRNQNKTNPSRVWYRIKSEFIDFMDPTLRDEEGNPNEVFIRIYNQLHAESMDDLRDENDNFIGWDISFEDRIIIDNMIIQGDP